MRGPGAAWKPYSEQFLKEARKLNKPAIIDFYAAWCTPCKELEEATFHDAAVVRLAEAEFAMLKVDVTQGGNPLHEQLILHYEVKGVPTIVFLDRNGVEHRDVRLVDYLPPEQFLGRMRALLKNDG
jgi:thiol:disulfide interchange protein DsbD